MDQDGSAVVGSRLEQRAGGCPSRHPLLDGCQLEIDDTHYDSALTFDLGGGRQWRKRIYPRQGYPNKLLRWNTVEEILSFLISFDSHDGWITHHVPQQPLSGTILFYDRSKTKKYREDGYDWKKRKSLSAVVREDRMKLKVGGHQLLYGCYAHSSSNPQLHRRTYWLIHNPNIVMVHYLEVVFSNHTHYRSTSEQGGLEPADTPSDWSMLTVSDPNLCALLEMVKEDKVDMTSQSLFTQLSLIFNNNLEQATTLEEALISNNTGLPVDMYQDTRSKKTKADALQSSSSSTKTEPVDGRVPVNPLFKAPHLVVCQSDNGGMSCFMTFPPPVRSSDAAMFPTGAKIPLPSLSQSTKLSLYSPQDSAKVGMKGRSKGKEKAGGTNKESGPKLFGVLSQMRSQVKQVAPVNTTQPFPSSKTDDYDPKKFTEFAHRLSDFDQSNTQGVRSRSLSSSSSNGGDYNTADMNSSINSEGAAPGCVEGMDLPCSSANSTSLEQNYSSPGPSFQSNSMQSNIPHLPTGQGIAANGTHSVPRDSELLNLDLDTESVQQLLQLSPGVSTDPTIGMEDQAMDASHPSSPLTQLINSLTSPEHANTQTLPENSSTTALTTESIMSHHGSRESFPVWNESSQQNTPPFSSSSVDLFNLNPHTVSFQSAQPSTPHPYNMQNSTSSSPPQHRHELLPQPQNHLPMNDYSHQGSFHPGFSAQLYSLPQASGNLETGSSLPFPGSLVPAHEYQDLESLMNTIITDNDHDPQSQVLMHKDVASDAMQTPTRAARQQACDSLGVYDSHSLNLSTSPSSHPDYGQASHHLSLPDLTLSDDTLHPSTSSDVDTWSQFYSEHNQPSTQSTSARSSSCLSSGPLQDIPEGLQMELDDVPPALHQLDVYDYRTGGSSIPSSPGQASVSSRSSISGYDNIMFETGSPSVFELCEMLSESPNVQQNDFSHLTLSDSEQQQLFRAAKTIQNAFRKYKDRRQARSQQKRAALMIEKYYKQYREAKEQQDHAARKIQQQYRDYRRSRDLNRAVLFVQQMYRYHRNKRSSTYPPTSTN